MFCRTCSREVDPQSVFCPSCGANPMLGTTFCFNCGQPTNPSAVVCLRCGVPFSQGSVTYGQAQNVSEAKSRIAYILLGLFLGLLGIHNFYAGYTNKAVTQLLVAVLLSWTVIAPIIIAVWCIIDVCTVTKDAQGRLFSS